MFRLFYIFSLMISLALIVAWLGCDKYNIVEPRFYDNDDITEIAGVDSMGDVCRYLADSGGTIGLRPVWNVPTRFVISVGWCDHHSLTLAVACALPMAGEGRLLVLNSGGGVEGILAHGMWQAGYFALLWTPEDEGVYGLVLELDEHRIGPRWFEVNR